MKQLQLRSDCPVNFVLEILGDKWSLLIIRDILLDGKRRYGEFLSSKEGIATNILSKRLVSLEAAGIIQQTQDPSNKTRYVYLLTRKGSDLLPMFVEMILWSAKYRPVTGPRKAAAEAAQKDKLRFIRSIRESLVIAE